MTPCKFDGSHLADQLRHIRTVEQIGDTPLCAICDSENHIAVLPPDATDLCRPSVLLYTERTTDEQIIASMAALSCILRGPFRALGITREQVRQCDQAGAMLVDYWFTSCTIPDGAVKINLTVETMKVC